MAIVTFAYSDTLAQYKRCHCRRAHLYMYMYMCLYIMCHVQECVEGSANPQTPGSENKRIKISVLCLQQAEERNFFISFSQNLGFVDLPIPV